MKVKRVWSDNLDIYDTIQQMVQERPSDCWLFSVYGSVSAPSPFGNTNSYAPYCPSVSPSVCRLHCKQSCGPPAAAGQQQHHISISQRMWAQRGLPGRRVLFCAYWHHRSTLCVSLITAQRLSRAADRRLSDRHCFLGTRDFLFIFWQLGICIGVFLNKI